MTTSTEERYSVAELWDGLHPHGVSRGVFVVYKVYIDESYDQKVFVLSCTVANGLAWKSFETAWGGVLDDVNAGLLEQGRPKIRRYHASECAGGFAEFKGWSVEEQIDLTQRLIGAMQIVPTHSVAHALLLDDVRETWAAKYGGAMPKEQTFQAAYMLATQHCMMALGSYLYRLNPALRLTFIHDHCDYDGVMLDAFNYVKYDMGLPYAGMFSTIAPMSSVDCLPLQLADFIAYEFFRDRRGEEFRPDDYRRRKSLAATLATGCGVSLRTIRRDWIEAILAENP